MSICGEITNFAPPTLGPAPSVGQYGGPCSYLSLVVTLQNVVALICHRSTMLAYVGVPKIWGRFLKLQDHVPPQNHASSLGELLVIPR